MLKRWRKSRWFQWATNKYTIGGVVFVVWMTFLDRNSIMLHLELNERLEELEEAKEYFETETSTDDQVVEELESSPEMLEKYAREEYYMHKEGEEVFIIEESE